MNENDEILEKVRQLLNGEQIEQKNVIQLKQLSKLINDFAEIKTNAEKADRTVNQYVRVMNLFKNEMTKRNKDEISKKDIIDYKRSLAEIFEKSTVNNYLVIINAFLKSCDKEEMCVELYKVQQKQSLKKVLEKSEYKRLLRWAKKHDYETYLIIKYFATSGARSDELKFLTVENIKQTNYIKVNNKGKERKVILVNDLRRELKKYCKEKGIEHGYIFTQKRDSSKPASKVTIWRHMQDVAGKARGIDKEKIHAHSFRHLFAITWVEMGYPLSELKDILGHSSIDTTTIYTRTTDEMKRKKMQEMKL